jgi:hypothetical protein
MTRRQASSDDASTVAEARARYFAANGFGDGGYDRRWVKLMAGPVPLYFPNTAQRVRSVRLHDIHHVLTDYETTWTGEGEIAAWEIASSCADHWAAWVLNFTAFTIGLCLDPRAMYRAFIRGRHSANLYVGEYESGLLRLTVAALRARLRLDRPAPPPSVRDRLAFFGWGAASLLTLAALPLLVAGALASLLR